MKSSDEIRAGLACRGAVGRGEPRVFCPRTYLADWALGVVAEREDNAQPGEEEAWARLGLDGEEDWPKLPDPYPGPEPDPEAWAEKDSGKGG